MQYTISAATFLALVSAAQAQTAGFDAILTPAKNEAVPACADYVLKWDYTSTYDGTVTIQILQGATPSTLQIGATIASGVKNSLASYTWPVDCALGADATYGIKITYDGDATGATFQYSNPFSIAAKAAATPSSTTAAPTTAAPAATSAAATSAAATVKEADTEEQTIYSTQYLTVTSCAATVTDCPARSTVVSTTSFPVIPTAPGTGESSVKSNSPVNGGAPPPAFTSVSPMTTGAPMYPAGNATGAGLYGVGGTVTLATKTTTGGAGPTSAIATAGAGRVAAGGAALVAGLVAAVFAL